MSGGDSVTLPRWLAPRFACKDQLRPVVSHRVKGLAEVSRSVKHMALSHLGRLPHAGVTSAKDAIDVVIAYVDGRDPAHRAKRKQYLTDPGVDAQPEFAAKRAERFSDNDEIRYCLRSIHNYAPWVRTIWLVTDNQVPAAINRRKAERGNIRIVDHHEIFRGYEQLLPTFNSLAIETLLWRIDGLADRFLYLNDDMMFVGPVEPTDFFSHEGKVKLRGRWSNWTDRPDKEHSYHGSNKLLAAQMLGYTPERFFSTHHVVYPILRPAMEALFKQFKPAFIANAKYRFRSREQFWPISAHDHLLLKSGRATVMDPSNSVHMSKRYCGTASRDALVERLKELTQDSVRMACVNYLEAVVEKVPDALGYLSKATGRAAPFETRRPDRYPSSSQYAAYPRASRTALVSSSRRYSQADSGSSATKEVLDRAIPVPVRNPG